MKRKLFFLSLLLGIFSSISIQAQIKMPEVSNVSDVANEQLKVPDGDFSKDLLNALNQGDKLGLSADKLLKLNNGNKSFVNNLTGILGGSGSDSDKLEQIGIKNKEREDFIEKLLGESKAKDYYKLAKEQIDKLKTKYQLAKIFL